MTLQLGLVAQREVTRTIIVRFYVTKRGNLLRMMSLVSVYNLFYFHLSFDSPINFKNGSQEGGLAAQE